MTLTRTQPLRKKRKPRRTTSPRCSTQRCNKRAEIRDLCVSHAERHADKLFSAWVRERDGRCTGAALFLATKCSGALQTAHIVGRRNHAVRYDPRNAHALCQAHHILIDQHGQEGAKFEWSLAVNANAHIPLMHDARQPADRRASIEAALAWLDPEGGQA